MTNGTIWLAIITLAPVIVLYFLGANAAPVFLSLCLGYVLYSFDTHNATNLANSLHQNLVHLKPTTVAINLVLLLGPAVITIISQIRSLHGSKRLFNLIPAAFCGLFTALLVVPVLPASLMSTISKSMYWGKLYHYQALVVGIGAAVSIAFFWMNSRNSESKKHHKAKQ